MSLENLSFYKANEKLPKKKQFNSNFPLMKEFPILVPFNKSELIPVNQRMNSTRAKPSYSAAMQSNQENKRKTTSPNKGYDKEAHKKAMWKPAHGELPSYSMFSSAAGRDRDMTKSIRSGKMILRNKETVYENGKPYELNTEMQNRNNSSIKQNGLKSMEMECGGKLSPTHWFSHSE